MILFKIMKRYLPHSLLGRSLLILILPILLMQIILTIVFFDRHWSEMTKRLSFAVSGEIAVIASKIETSPGQSEMTELSTFAAQGLEMLISFEPNAVIVDDPERKPWDSLIRARFEDEFVDKIRRPFRIYEHVPGKMIEIVVQLDNGVLRVLCPLKRLFTSTTYIFILWMAGTSLVMLGIAIIFMRNQVRPIKRLAIAAEAFGKGRDIPEFKPEGAREVRQAATAFIDMRDRIKKQILQRTAMLASVSHDLKTPLTRMKLQLAMLPSNPDTDAIRGDIVDMERMIEGYLAFARGEGGETMSPTDIGKMVDRLVKNFRRQGASVQAKIGDNIMLSVRPMAIERCIMNIMSNARKYADHFWVDVAIVGDNIEIVVEDDGPGIPADRMDDVFKPFVRLEASRNQATGGIGLGLSIAQDIAHAHGGKITLGASPEHGGSRVVLSLPL